MKQSDHYYNGSSTSTQTSSKRKRNVLSIETKLKIIEDLKKVATAVSLSEKYGVPRTTINDLKKDSSKIEVYASRMEALDGRTKKRKTIKSATNESVDTAVWLWFVQKRSEGVPLSGPMVCEKAILFNEKMNGNPEFKASSGWLKNFKNRHGIRELLVEGEKMSSATVDNCQPTVDNFMAKFLKLITDNNLTREQVYNADETGLNYRV